MRFDNMLRIFFDKFLWSKRSHRRLTLKLLDLVTFFVVIQVAMIIRFEALGPEAYILSYMWQMLLLIALQFLCFTAFGMYRAVLRYSSLDLARVAAQAVGASTVTLIAITYFSGNWALSRSVLLINAMLLLIVVVTGRLFLRRWVLSQVNQRKRRSHWKKLQRVVIYGAGSAGAQLLQALEHHSLYRVVAFVDDDPEVHHSASIDGHRVFPAKHLQNLWVDNKFDLVVLAMPSISPKKRREIIEHLQQFSIPVKTVPDLGGILSGEVKINEIRDIDIADLLGRKEETPNLILLQKQTRDKVVLVTGAGGSIGSELCRQIIQQRPQCLILYELNEFALYQIHQELIEAHPEIPCIPCLGNVVDQAYLSSILRAHQVDTVYHAAAYKHVPLLESNIAKGVENNVRGTCAACHSAIEAGVHQFVLISTDKAVRPTNIMGTTKRVAELIVQALAMRSHHRTQFAIVRFGNVLGSSGSVVPKFRQQIARGGPITLTHRDITRYFMSIPEAARLVIQAGALSKGGEVFLLDMGEPVKIYDLAIQMIRLSGLVPEEDIAIDITGLRPGEKLYEELLISGDNIEQTRHEQIFCSREYFLPWEELLPQLEQLFACAANNDILTLKPLLKKLVPEYTPERGAAADNKVLQPIKSSPQFAQLKTQPLPL
jgi:FlaA1/EpsC-like NDP-sugar epimerase